MPYFLLLGNPIQSHLDHPCTSYPSTLIVDQKWHWQVVVQFNRATKLNIQAIFRGGLLCSHSFGGKSYYIAILPGGGGGGGIPLYSHFSGGKSYYIVIFPWGKTGYGGKMAL